MQRFRSFLSDESGQAVIEYILLLIAVIAVVGTLKSGLKELTAKFWSFLAKKIAAPCPTCDAGEEFDLN